MNRLSFSFRPIFANRRVIECDALGKHSLLAKIREQIGENDAFHL
jgi:hypothetical protein